VKNPKNVKVTSKPKVRRLCVPPTELDHLKEVSQDYISAYSHSPKVIVLATGGLDSTLCIARLCSVGFDVTPLFFDYGQYPKRLEEQAVRRCIDNLILKYYSKAPFIWKGFLQSVEKSTISLNPTLEPGIANLNGREVMLIGAAASWAYIHGNDYNYIAIGSHSENVAPGCKPGEFDSLMDMVLSVATEGKMNLLLPIRDLLEEQVGKELHEYLNLKLTYNCYWDPTCGFKSKKEIYRCPGCQRKALSMKSAGAYTEEEMKWPNLTRKTYEPLDGIAEDRK
jgi:7-cyano-7-deazaguanine synthase